mmetsp:Transcript_59670/g.136866  ORF Transcript_59670/g.136866 Transcript_59670/m.136866 type:complete len:261 (+) Transcript_59670:981-1763(+)
MRSRGHPTALRSCWQEVSRCNVVPFLHYATSASFQGCVVIYGCMRRVAFEQFTSCHITSYVLHLKFVAPLCAQRAADFEVSARVSLLLRSREDFPVFLAHLAYTRQHVPTEWLSLRIFDAIGLERLTMSDLCSALAGQYASCRRTRLSWVWRSIYDTASRRQLSAIDIFSLLEHMPSGCTLEDDMLSLVQRAASKVENGERALVTENEYIEARMSIEVPEPDPLAIRPSTKAKRPRGAGMRCRARALMLAQQLGGKGRAT